MSSWHLTTTRILATLWTAGALWGCEAEPDIEGNAPGECSDRADNDMDGLYDCEDPSCFGAPICQDDVYPTEHNLFDTMPKGSEQLDLLCDRLAAGDVQSTIRDVFCGATRPEITNSQQLLEALGLGFYGPLGLEAQMIWDNGNPAWAAAGHSAGLSRRSTSSVNPRVIIHTPVASHLDPTPGFVVVSMARGEPFAEIMTHDPQRDDLDFFMFRFDFGCEDPQDCSDEERFSDAWESGWSDYTVYDAADLENTTFDCLHCHEHGLRTARAHKRAPLMFQLNSIWMHWLYNVNYFRGWTDNASDQGPLHHMLEQYVEARATPSEPLGGTFGGIPGGALHASRPKSLEDLIEANGFGNGFDPDTYEPNGAAIGLLEDDRARGLIFDHPWEELYELNLNGLLIAPPARGASPFHNGRLEQLISDMSAYRNGNSTNFPDPTDIFRSSDLSAVGTAVHPGLSPPEILVHACTECHHDALNPRLSKSRFKLGAIARGRSGSSLGDHFSSLDEAQLLMASQRINLPSDHLAAMPPARFRNLTDQEKETVTQWLTEVSEGLAMADDGLAPEPQVPEFDIAPREVELPGPPHLSGSMTGALMRRVQTSMAVMRARPGADPRGYVEYYFEELSGSPGGNSSGWQMSPRYVDRDLELGERYRYRFKMRDRAGNESAFSAEAEFQLSFVNTDCDHDEHEHPALEPDGEDTDCDSLSNNQEGYDTDSDSDGIPDYLDEDDDGDGITTYAEREDGVKFGNDVDGDGVPNWLDTDSDDDGTLDAIEGGGDSNNNGLPGYLDPDE
ncbi:MAG: hypothetical protein CMP23_13950 [Rickettsiales bacterium]|nr:hypothetical protein [Rickettsiales bacterium]